MTGKKEKPYRELSSYYLSLTKLWIPSFPAAAMLNDMATMTAGIPALKRKKK